MTRSGQGRVALVTGASSGIGKSTAFRLHRAGFTVYAAARRTELMSGLAKDGIRPLHMDVTDEDSMTGGIERILSEAGRIDVLVNNAGYGSYGAVEDVSIDEARRQFEVNLFGMARLTQLVTPPMRERNHGRIINISSIGAVIYEPFGAWYHATKFAVEGFSDSLRVELKPFGIDVVIVRPAGIVTEWNKISRENLIVASRGGRYEDRAKSAARTLRRVDNRVFSSGPRAVAKKVVKAATSSHPRTRYPAGRGARMIPLARRVLPDRVFDFVLDRAYLR